MNISLSCCNIFLAHLEVEQKKMLLAMLRCLFDYQFQPLYIRFNQSL
jgi:hypothetical protein